ncbi:hypothetical protein DFQ29_008916 [Apophysomyces sp. BC1021]|nr:hypothetical protein DFQ29_008916 [Apophysomyces sp. BC1021]
MHHFHSFEHAHREGVYREQLWEEIFCLDRVMPRRRRYQGRNNDQLPEVEFDHSFETDGVMVSVRFKSRKPNQTSYRSSQRDFRMLRRDKDLSNQQSGIYHLKKEPTGLTVARDLNPQLTRIIGVDPGMSHIMKGTQMIYAIKQPERITHLRLQTATIRRLQIGLKTRSAANNMQEVYDRLEDHPSTAASVKDF